MAALRKMIWWSLIAVSTVSQLVFSIPPPPVQNKTTIILYTDIKTWNEAKLVCESLGQKLLDITYYSLYITVGSMALISPWVDLPVGNGPPKWIGLHRRVTPLGDEFYSVGCQTLTDFNVRYWGGVTPYVPDGDPNSYCVHHETLVDPMTGGGFSSKADYTMADCSEKHMFYCQKEEGPCPFDILTDQHGDTSTDFTSNDINLPFESVDACKQLCFLESNLITSSNDVTEECWGFTITATECIIHIVVKPSFFDTGNYNPSPGSTLYIKKCFYTDINTDTFDVGVHDSLLPDSTCGTPVLENSTLWTKNVTVYTGIRTWNEAFQICQGDGQTLLDINNEDMYPNIQNLVANYPHLSLSGGLWLGFHEPDPQHYPSFRLWSDCSTSPVPSNWDPDKPPSTSVYDANLCVVINTANFEWEAVSCDDKHSFVCLGERDPAKTSIFETGASYTVGDGVSLGPYNYSRSECGAACSDWAYQGQECRAVAYRYSAADGHVCHLYYADDFLYYDTNTQTSPQNFTFYKKRLWTVHEAAVLVLEAAAAVTRANFIPVHEAAFTPTAATDATDATIFPYSCCDLSTVDTSEKCPPELPEYEPNLPTTTKQKFVLHTIPHTWNEASDVCQDGGGRLVRLDGVSKRLALQYYAASWQTKGHIAGLLWSGLIIANTEDACSYRWPHTCTTPDWVAFQDAASTCSDNCLCGAVDVDMETVMIQCNENLQFICEYDSPDACAVDELLVDLNCYLEGQGEYSIQPLGTCNDLCLTDTHMNKECWTTIDIDNFSCALMFYLHPFYCKMNNDYLPDRKAYFKNCYLDEVDIGTATDTPDTSQTPLSDCFQPFVYPYSKEAGRCNESTTTSASTATVSTTLTQTTTSPAATSTLTVTTTVSTTSASTPSFTTSTTQTSTQTTTKESSTTSSTSVTPFTLPTAVSSSSSSTSSTTSSLLSTSTVTSPLSSTSSTTSSVSSTFETSVTITPHTSSSSSTTSGPTTATIPVSPPSIRSIPTPVQTIVPISVASSIVVPIASLPQAVQDENFTDPVFLWPCMCNTASQNEMTTEEWTVWLTNTHAITKYNTSKYKRKLACAGDKRTSSASIGIVAIIVLTSFAGVIIILDSPTVISNITLIHGALKAKIYKPQKRMSET